MPLRDPMADYCPVEKSFTKVKYNRPLIVHVLIGYPPSKKLDGSLRQKKKLRKLLIWGQINQEKFRREIRATEFVSETS